MSPTPLISLRLRYQEDLIAARQQLRTLLAALGAGAQDQTRWTTALSEVLRGLYDARRRLRLELELPTDDPLRLVARVTAIDVPDDLPDLDRAARLVDGCTSSIEDEKGLVVTLWRRLNGFPRPDAARLKEIRARLRGSSPRSPYEEMQFQNEELMSALEALRLREEERQTLLDGERKARAEAQREALAREQILSVVSHDLNNPLAVILNTATWLEATTEDPDRRHRIGGILRAGRRAKRLITDLLDLSHIDAQRLSLVRRSTNLTTLTREAAEEFRDAATTKGITLVVTVPDGPTPARVDSDRFLQVLDNLLSNAVKFTPDGGRVELTLASGDDGVRLSVTDDGPGIPTDHQDQVFDRFWQAEATRHQGSGLGLAIAEGIVSGHGGRLQVESEEGNGSRFTIHLPTDRIAVDDSETS